MKRALAVTLLTWCLGCSDSSTTNADASTAASADAAPPRDATSRDDAAPVRDSGVDELDGAAQPDAGAADADADAGSADVAVTPGDGGGAGDPDAMVGSADASTMMIGMRGGTVTSGGGSGVIPAGALNTSIPIGVAESALPIPLPANVEAASAAYVFTPHGTMFTQAATIRLAFTGSADRVMRLDDERDTTWETITGVTVGATSVSFEAPAFSIYVVARPSSVPTVVRPLYPAAPRWNDYVIHDGVDASSATNTVCDRAASIARVSHGGCLHGGEMRAVTVTGRASCANLTASDALSAFEWTCRVQNNVATMISTKLQESVRMAALIDFSAGQWRANSVTVRDGATTVLTTPAELWWSNAMNVDNGTATSPDLAEVSRITLVTADSSRGYSLSADHAALVVQPGRRVGPITRGPAVPVSQFRFAGWIEGDFVGDITRPRAVGFSGVQSVLRYVRVTGENAFVEATATINPRIEHVTIDGGNGGLAFTVAGNGAQARGALVRDLRVSNGNVAVGGGLGHTFEGVFASSNQAGVRLGEGSIAADLTVVHNADIGLSANAGSLAMHVTSANNASWGLSVGGLLEYDTMIIGLASTQNRVAGVQVGSFNITFHDAVVWANTHYGFQFNDSRVLPESLLGFRHRFRGGFGTGQNGGNPPTNWYVGQACVANSYLRRGDCFGTRSSTNMFGPDGLRTTAMAPYSCELDTNSDASVVAVGGTGGFFPMRAQDDMVNTSDNVDGLGAFASITDWHGFENRYRGWGAQGSATPDCLAQGRCDATAMGSVGCQVYDYSLRTSIDEVLRVPSRAPPTGNDVLSMDFPVGDFFGLADEAACRARFSQPQFLSADASHPYPRCRVTFLAHAREVLRDSVGNDNLLCESGETCLFTPNRASYQGHGPLVPRPGFTFVNGTITGVTLLQHETNGVAAAFRP